MKALCLIGSPRKGGNSDCMADAFLQSVRHEGCEGSKVYVSDLSIHPIGEVSDAWDERKDVYDGDDWRPTVESMIATDILVWATPVYWQGIPAQLKCLVDRWSAHYTESWLVEGLAGKVWVVLCPYGHPQSDESPWVVRPIQVWARHWRGTYLGDVCVSVSRRGAVKSMSQVMARVRELGRRAVQAARPE